MYLCNDEPVATGDSEENNNAENAQEVAEVAGSDNIIEGNNGKNTLDGTDDNDTINGYGNKDTIDGAGGNDLINGGDGDDYIAGGAGDDTLVFMANQGDDTADGGAGGWMDTIELGGFDGQASGDGWTINLENGSTIESTDDLNGEMLLSEDSAGSIEFDDGGSVSFENIDKIIW